MKRVVSGAACLLYIWKQFLRAPQRAAVDAHPRFTQRIVCKRKKKKKKKWWKCFFQLVLELFSLWDFLFGQRCLSRSNGEQIMQHHLPLFTLVAVGISNRKSYSSKQLANVE